MIIDFHTHTFPDELAKKTIPYLESKAGFVARTDGTIKGLKKSMEEANIDISILLPVVTSPKQTLKINDCAIENNKLDGFISFGGIHPDFEDYKNELKRLKDNGIKGIKLHPDYQNTFIDDLKYINIVNEAFRLGLVVIIHSGIDYGSTEVIRATPERIKNLLNNLEYKGTFILAHMGYTFKWDMIIDEFKDYDVYFDLALCLGVLKMNDKYYPLMDEKTLIKFINTFGSEKILFATDSPWMGQKESIDMFNSFKNISQKDKDNILYKNAIKILEIKG
ncbi:MAG: amidohydrolase family protein [Acholeplasmatales bacterium]|nr:amidohydrolase family protein [Acholeplasmatales bacterium]